MKINGRLSSYQIHPEIDIEKEAAELASRIMNRARQKQNLKSTKTLTIKDDGSQSSEYQFRPSEFSDIHQGTNSITDRNEIDFKPYFRQPQKSEKQHQSNPIHIEIVKNSSKINFQQQSSSKVNDTYQNTIKFSNKFYAHDPISQSTDRPDSNKQIKMIDSINSAVHGKSEPTEKNRKIDNTTHSKQIQSIKTIQISTPLKQNKEEIVLQLLGSLRNSNKYQEYTNSVQK